MNNIFRISVVIVLIYLVPSCKKNDDTLIKDLDGNVYTSVTIGTQVWMVENLKTTKYNDGIDIPLITDNTEWKNTTTPAYCWYDNDISNKNPYGALYNWQVVNTDKLCPLGWRVPSDEDWTTLSDYLGGQNIAGGKLKEMGTTHWENPNSDASNESGFTALPGGYRGTNGIYYDMHDWGNWWSSSTYDGYQAWLRWLYYDDAIIGRGFYSKPSGISVRCIKDN